MGRQVSVLQRRQRNHARVKFRRRAATRGPAPMFTASAPRQVEKCGGASCSCAGRPRAQSSVVICTRPGTAQAPPHTGDGTQDLCFLP